jgi:hypothetical protein
LTLATGDYRLFLMGTLKLVFGFGLFLAVGILLVKVVPPFFSNYELEDAMKTEATQSTYTSRSEEDIRESVIKEARKYDIALTPKQVKVTRIGSFGSGTLSIEAEYSVPLDLPGYSTNLDFHPTSKNTGVY